MDERTLLMTPGPTYVSEDVRQAMARRITNPDLDPSFFEYYMETCGALQQLLKTQNKVLILAGEGILGLEAACASLIEPGDRVLCLDNGIFGNGFADFAKIYGAEAVFFKSDYDRGLDPERLKEFLKGDSDFKVATLVHCETPSGVTNPLDRICPLLKEHGIISVVDAVSAVGGEELHTDAWEIDVLLGASQKCISAPPGLTFMSISKAAWDKINSRSTPIAGYYCNLSTWAAWYENRWFPYTQSVSDIYGLRVAVERLLSEGNPQERHRKIAGALRSALESSGLKLYAQDSHSNTVTAIVLPDNIGFDTVFNQMLKEHNIMIAGSLGYLKDKAIRIGHMGENCYEDKVYMTLKALGDVLEKNGVKLGCDMHIEFARNMKK